MDCIPMSAASIVMSTRLMVKFGPLGRKMVCPPSLGGRVNATAWALGLRSRAVARKPPGAMHMSRMLEEDLSLIAPVALFISLPILFIML